MYLNVLYLYTLNISYFIKTKSLYQVIKKYHKKDFENPLLVFYEGEVNHTVTRSVTMLTENLLLQKNADRMIIKKVFNILVECLQNLDKHLEDGMLNNGFSTKTGCVCVIKEADGISLITANLIEEQYIASLKCKLEGLQNKSKEEIRRIYKEQLAMGRISEKGGAGLGFIDMARKSGQPFFFSFDPFFEKHSVFFLKFKVSN